MKRILSIIAAITATIVFTGCNVQVDQGHVGKVLGPTGFQPEVYPPGIVNIDNGPFTRTSMHERMIQIETTTQKFVEPVKVLLRDKLTLRFSVVFRGRVTSDRKRQNAIFNDMKLDDNIITTQEVYYVYGKMVILNTARAVMSKYNVDEVNTNYARITEELYQALAPKLQGLPIDISDVTIGEIKYPDIVTNAIEAAKKRRMEIEQEQANVQIALTKKAGEKKLAEADYDIRMLEAKRIRDYNAMTAKGITPELITLRKLELQEKALEVKLAEANKWDGQLPKSVMNGSMPVLLNTSAKQ